MQRKRISIFFSLLALLLISGCGSSKKALQAPKDFALTIQRTACFGTCPIFVLTVNHKGIVDYKGERFVQYIGHYRKHLEPAKFKFIVEKMQNSKFNEMNDNYDNEGISDLPSVIITYTSGGKTKTVLCRYDCPKEFSTLLQDIESTIGDSGYLKVDDPQN